MQHWIIYLLSGGLLIGRGAVAQSGPASGNGLRGEYYSGERFEEKKFTRIDPAIDFDWNFQQPGPSVAAERFSVRWTGYLLAPVSGVYTLHVIVDDGMRVWLNGRKVLDEWRHQPTTYASKQVRLQAGQYYSLRVEYFQGSAPTRAFLGWVIPQPKPERGVGNLFGLMAEEPQPVAIPTRYLLVERPSLPITRPVPPVAKAAPAVASTAAAKTAAAAPTKAAPAALRRKVSVVVPTRAPRQSPRPSAPAPANDLSQLDKLPAGAMVALQHLYFEQSKPRLLPTSLPEMERLAQILKDNPTLRLEIVGHTDNIGDANLNLILSQQRAEAVRDYLLRQGIAAERLLATGRGGTQPVADNNDPQQRPRNRRVEVVVL
jgi:outer membrane protein OmpA-like peptidoglycan-associated protein